MEVLSTAAFRARLAEIVNRVSYGHERFILERRGKLAVAVVSLEDLRLLEEYEKAGGSELPLVDRPVGPDLPEV